MAKKGAPVYVGYNILEHLQVNRLKCYSIDGQSTGRAQSLDDVEKTSRLLISVTQASPQGGQGFMELHR